MSAFSRMRKRVPRLFAAIRTVLFAADFTMKPFLAGPNQPATEALLLLQQELVATIRGALEVAADIAVREVKTLVGQATGDMYKELRLENEGLKQKLQRAEEMLVLVNTKGSSDEHSDNEFSAKKPHEEVKGESSRPGGADFQRSDEEQRSARSPVDGALKQRGNRFTDVTAHLSAAKVETSQPSQISQTSDSAEIPSTARLPCLEQVAIKQEEPEDESEGFDWTKNEDLVMKQLQKTLDIQNQEPHTGPWPDHSNPPEVRRSLTPPSDLQPAPPGFHLGEAAAVSPQTHAVKVRRGLHTCKFCTQMFHLPSLLRQHYSQCRQRLQQRPQSNRGGARTKLQLYPPGCSPFRCSICSREFNRMENLKTHLRIHTGERPFTCSVCFKCFRHSGALTRHFRIHTGEKPYVCSQCGKSFRNCGGLRFHQRSRGENCKSLGQFSCGSSMLMWKEQTVCTDAE